MPRFTFVNRNTHMSLSLPADTQVEAEAEMRRVLRNTIFHRQIKHMRLDRVSKPRGKVRLRG